MAEHDIPFEVGQVVESKSFIQGFRGAWFRCKIEKIAIWSGEPRIALEYIDFPDEKILWTKLYQTGKGRKTAQLMLRPCFPTVYHKGEKIDVGSISEVTVIVEDMWKVGDLVDWFADGCYWSGRVTKILKNEKLQIDLPPPPDGEGLTYDVCPKELRPSLNWSPECGWTIPTITDGEHNRQCARLIKRVNEGRPVSSSVPSETRRISADESPHALLSSKTLSRSPSSSPELKSELGAEGPLRTNKPNKSNVEPSGSGVQKSGTSDTISISDIRKDKEKVAATSSENLRSESMIRLKSSFSDTLEDAILDLETLVSHVRRLQNILKFDMPSCKTSQSLLRGKPGKT